LNLTHSGNKTLFLETGKSASALPELPDFSYPLEDTSSCLASGFYPNKTVMHIAGHSDDRVPDPIVLPGPAVRRREGPYR